MTAWRQVGALIGLRWRLVRSLPVKLGLLTVLAGVPLLAWAIVAGSSSVQPEAYAAAITAASAAYLGFGMLALIAPLTAGGGTELLPPDHSFGLGVAVKTRLGGGIEPGSVGSYGWSGAAGTAFFVDPQEALFAVLMAQAPGQLDELRELFRQMVYAAIDD